MSMIRKASRKHRYLKIGIGGISGSGKTLGALKMAYGITGDWEKICVIDSENNSADLYAQLGPYSVLPLTDTSPQGYLKAFKEVIDSGYEVMIVDSMSHEYAGKGGLLEIADKIASTSKSGNSFAAWSKATPMHNEWLDNWLQAPIHVIGTLRKKSDYVLEQNDKGKSAPRKIGLKSIQRDGTSYEFDVLLDISMNHLCSVEKDRTSLFDGKMAFDLTEKVGEALRAWANEGAIVDESTTVEPAPVKPTKPQKKFEVDPVPYDTVEAPAIFEDKPENKKLILEHFKNMELVLDKNNMMSAYAAMLGKPMDMAEDTLVSFCKELKDRS